MYRLMAEENLQGEVVNIGNTNEITILELAEIILEQLETSSEIVHRPLPTDDPKRRRPSIERAEKLLDWSPTVDLREGIRQTAEYFKN
jgi:nucleoside-diphosphate-sugar epimerase